MKENLAEETIIYHCLNRKGFLAKLKVERVFDERAYQLLRAAIRDYREEVSDSDVISRKIAGCLHFLVHTLLLELDEFPDSPANAQLVQDAHAECWELAQGVFELQ